MSVLSAGDDVYWLEIFCICSGIVQGNSRLATDTNKQMHTIPLQPEVKLLISKTGSEGTMVAPVQDFLLCELENTSPLVFQSDIDLNAFWCLERRDFI